MNATLPGVDAPVRDVSKSQWFTPPELARRIVEWSLVPYADKRNKHGCYEIGVLEPSAGDGALLRHILSHVEDVYALDLDPGNMLALRRLLFRAACADFLTWPNHRRYHLAVMNPPFESGQTEAHITRALEQCDRVVCHCPLTTLEGRKRKAALWDKVQLHRMVIHRARPKYGEKGGATAMMTIDVTLGHTGAATQVEWWM